MILAPRFWLGHLLVIVAIAAAGGLGVWQWTAFDKHREAQARDLMSQPAIPLQQVMGPDDPFPAPDVGRPVTLRGTWIPDSVVVIERDGERWLTQAVQIDDAAMYVVLGSGGDDIESQIRTGDTGLITGWLQPPEGTGASDRDPSDDILPQLRIADLIQHVDVDLYGAFVISTEPIGDLVGVTPAQLPKADATTGLRNLLYAIEWWIFGLFAVFMWWKWLQEMRHPDPEPATDGEPADSATVGSPP